MHLLMLIIKLKPIEGSDANSLKKSADSLINESSMSEGMYKFVDCAEINVGILAFRLVIYSSMEYQTSLVFYFMPGRNSGPNSVPENLGADLFSKFDDDSSLVTTSLRNRQSNPKPPSYHHQQFPGSGLDQLHSNHMNALEHISQVKEVMPTDPPVDIIKVINESVQEELSFIRTKRFWYLRYTYWFFAGLFKPVNNPLNLDIS
ncbi:hypothetical protein [Mucisphaera sp.]|uniref:hypothetical protein n=1 Tax=Mucisphaera sp. TaxID=2913024 RepID=UPI003D1448B7